MIQCKSDLRDYLEHDRRALMRTEKHPRFGDLIWKYEIGLRYCEYYKNCKKGFFNRMIYKLLAFRRSLIGNICNFHIGENVFEKGLSIAHKGPIIVNGHTHIGENCRIHVGVNIGTMMDASGQAPQIGKNVYIGPGAKLFGKITIADGVAIGANAVVNKDCLEENVSLGGVPATIISRKGTRNRNYLLG